MEKGDGESSAEKLKDGRWGREDAAICGVHEARRDETKVKFHQPVVVWMKRRGNGECRRWKGGCEKREV